MDIDYDLSRHIQQRALEEGALLAGFTKIRKVEPVILFAFPFTDHWFLNHPFKTSSLLKKDYALSKHVQDVTAGILKKEGYSSHYKTILSLYGDFRPLAVSAGFGEWGRNGIVVNKDYGSGLLFAGIFTDAPLDTLPPQSAKNTEKHCVECGQCIQSCPANAFEGSRFHGYRCLPHALKGCAECLKACKSKVH